MPRPWLLRVTDILEAIERIEQYIKGMDSTTFDNDPKTRDATLYNMLIVGEASTQIPEEAASKFPRIPWIDIRGMRNILAHEYFGVKTQIIWKAITEDIPRLKLVMKEILKNEPDG